ncbi:hypothetical protein GLDPPO_GLDPPO_12485, partial [Dysosmobacter welbionis]
RAVKWGGGKTTSEKFWESISHVGNPVCSIRISYSGLLIFLPEG